MSEEKIIENFIKDIEMLVNAYNYQSIELGIKEGLETLGKRIDTYEGLLDLYYKQQKEIEELKSRLDFIAKQIEQCANATEQTGYWASLEEK